MPIGRNIAVLNLPSPEYTVKEDDILVVSGWGSTDVSTFIDTIFSVNTDRQICRYLLHCNISGDRFRSHTESSSFCSRPINADVYMSTIIQVLHYTENVMRWLRYRRKRCLQCELRNLYYEYFTYIRNIKYFNSI